MMHVLTYRLFRGIDPSAGRVCSLWSRLTFKPFNFLELRWKSVVPWFSRYELQLSRTPFYAGELTFVGCGCSTRKLPRTLSELAKIFGYSATRTLDHSVLEQELPSVGGVQGSGVLHPRFSLCIPWLFVRSAFEGL